MKEYAHISVSIGIGSLLLSLFYICVRINLALILSGLVWFAVIGNANDWLDFRFSKDHKRVFLTHSPFSPLLLGISILSGMIAALVQIGLGLLIATGTYLIFLGHFFLDSLNPSGVPVMPKTRFSLNITNYDNITWNLVFFVLGGSLMIISLIIYVSV